MAREIVLNLSSIENARIGARIIAKWEKEGYGFKFVPYKEFSHGHWCMGYEVKKVKLPKGREVEKLK